MAYAMLRITSELPDNDSNSYKDRQDSAGRIRQAGFDYFSLAIEVFC